MIDKLVNRKWAVLESHYIIREGDWCTIRKEKVQLPNGHIIPAWYIMEFPNWVNIIAITDDGQFVFIDQYRHALGQTHYELVAGVVDPTDVSPMEAAKRELLEEAGYGEGQWEQFMVTSPNPTNHTNFSYTFIARGVKKISEQHLEASEDIHIHLLTQEEVYQILNEGEIIQALHAAPLWKYFAINHNL